ncbi:MAG: SpoIVB peptidase [Firmicutes bacterium]|nr:SpoIVB peptidase [Bacillota bacterium]
MRNYSRNRNIFFLLVAFILLFAVLLYFQINAGFDKNLRLFEGDEQNFDLKFPLNLYIRADKEGILNLNGNPINCDEYNRLAFQKGISLQGLSKGSVNLELSLFKGLIPIRQLTVDVLPEMRLIPGGHSIGIKLHEKGVIVAGYFYLEKGKGFFSPAEESGVLIGDVVAAINEQKIRDIDTAAEIIKTESGKGPLIFTVNRNGEVLKIKITPYLCPNSHEKRIGLYIRDTAAGVGTLTFFDNEKKCYGALGHIITDIDTNKALEINEGLIVRADIINVKIAERGQPGEKAGIFRTGKDILGTINKNTNFGIYGRIRNIEKCATPYPDAIPLGLAFQVETGPAEILTVIEGNTIQSFKIEIEKITNQNKPVDKGMIIRVVDENLLRITGGIIQGMSGSPIIQNGRLVGAVTHVFVNDPTRGYGIYAEWMVKEMELISGFLKT